MDAGKRGRKFNLKRTLAPMRRYPKGFLRSTPELTKATPKEAKKMESMECQTIFAKVWAHRKKQMDEIRTLSDVLLRTPNFFPMSTVHDQDTVASWNQKMNRDSRIRWDPPIMISGA
ncbi:MAG: hypothetical protein MUC62_10300 [Candidatus Thermoplasmatota archaeon]|nr:hypothetical protein [Candidatus Thermoplasmatota archaeon]